MSELRCSYCGSSFDEQFIQGHLAFCSKREYHDRLPGVGIPLRSLLLAFFVSGLFWWMFWWAAFGARADHGTDWELKNTLPTDAVETFEEAHPPPPPPPPEPTGVERWRPLVEVYDWDVEHMLRIMHCESRGIPTAVSHTDDHGLFQIHYPIWGPAFDVSRTDLYEPVLNTDVAYRVFDQQGYGAWVCHRIIS